MFKELSLYIDDKEFLYRGIHESQWDSDNNKPNSSIFKDSKGVSVDRDGFRDETTCINLLKQRKDFFAICKVETGIVRDLEAIVKYKPVKNNKYHSEIYDSETRINMTGSKPKKIRDKSQIVYRR